jgi:hypothetical protein
VLFVNLALNLYQFVQPMVNRYHADNDDEKKIISKMNTGRDLITERREP